MPPKIKVSKEQVLNTAFDMTREAGFNALTARKLAERLNSSTQPIFRVYESMDTLREDLFYKCVEFFGEKLEASVTAFEPAYYSMSLKYVELALSEYNLFDLIASVDRFENNEWGAYLKKGETEGITDSFPDSSKLTAEQKTELLNMLWIFTHGLAVMMAGKRIIVDEDGAGLMIKRAYDGFFKAVAG
ncbi:MAG: hypothetical protein K6G22_02875 [Lachnospiraceae bacterium]|nr:hypothetical protein [Lachnospiraceae bacterium]